MECASDKSKYNKDFTPYQAVEANNYVETLAERYQCFNYSKRGDNCRVALGQQYEITLTTILEE